MKTLLKTENLNKEYVLGGFPRSLKINALNDINLTVEGDRPVIISGSPGQKAGKHRG